MKAKKMLVNTALGMATFLTCAFLPLAGNTAEVTLPYHINGTATLTMIGFDPATGIVTALMTDVGQASYVGRYSNSGTLFIDSATGVFLSGTGEMITASGEISKWIMVGSRIFNNGGTGRWANASGYFDGTPTSDLVTNPDGTKSFTYIGSGWFIFAN